MFVGAKHDDRVRSENIQMNRRGGTHGAGGARHCVHHQRCFGDTETGAAVFLGHGDSEPSTLGDSPVEFLGKLAALVTREPVVIIESRTDLLYRIAYGLLVWCQRKIHRPRLRPPLSKVASGHLATT